MLNPASSTARSVGEVLADMHLAGQSYRGQLDNPRGPRWWTTVAPEIYPFLSDADVELLKSEIRFQASHRHDRLPRGVIHAGPVPRQRALHRRAQAPPVSAGSSISILRVPTCSSMTWPLR